MTYEMYIKAINSVFNFLVIIKVRQEIHKKYTDLIFKNYMEKIIYNEKVLVLSLTDLYTILYKTVY